MGKKCIPGVICVENMTLMLLIIISILLIYIYYAVVSKKETKTSNYYQPNSEINNALDVNAINQKNTPINHPSLGISILDRIQTTLLTNVSSRSKDINDPYIPPLRTEIELPTYNSNSSYQQVGILTKMNGNEDNMILPLMGRQLKRNRNKWQYYTMSNSGNLNTKLPISIMGKSCTSEYGCDELMNNDKVYVEGYNNIFTVTIYENNVFTYNPF